MSKVDKETGEIIETNEQTSASSIAAEDVARKTLEGLRPSPKTGYTDAYSGRPQRYEPMWDDTPRSRPTQNPHHSAYNGSYGNPYFNAYGQQRSQDFDLFDDDGLDRIPAFMDRRPVSKRADELARSEEAVSKALVELRLLASKVKTEGDGGAATMSKFLMVQYVECIMVVICEALQNGQMIIGKDAEPFRKELREMIETMLYDCMFQRGDRLHVLEVL